MKKYALLIGLGAAILPMMAASAANVDLQALDADSRAVIDPTNNSIMFRRNAEQYRQLSDEEKA
ncbi:MAG: hypothetical protein IJ824_04750, partial [Alphaproteobacteria bacterium]|nr:hypothetical protein [Alphaproteobacteria bacterium]